MKKCRVKLQGDETTNILQWLKLKKQTIASVDRNVDQFGVSYIAYGSVIGYIHFEKYFAVSYKIKSCLSYHLTEQFYSSIYQRETYDHRKTCINIPSSFIHNSQTLGTTQVIISRWINRL